MYETCTFNYVTRDEFKKSFTLSTKRCAFYHFRSLTLKNICDNL